MQPSSKQVQEVIALIKVFEPSFSIKYKNSSFLMKVLSKILFFNKKFMTETVTTIGKTVYLPDEKYLQKYGNLNYVEMLVHEARHIMDSKRLGIAYYLLYLSPQIFSLLSVFSFFNSWFLLCLLFLLPLPSPGRAYIELRAYLSGLAVLYHLSNKIFLVNPIVCLKYFTGPDYYYMFPFQSIVVNSLCNGMQKIMEDDVDGFLKQIKNILSKKD